VAVLLSSDNTYSRTDIGNAERLNAAYVSPWKFSIITEFLFLHLDNEIVCFLKVQIAEAINLQDKNLMAQLQETMRCVCRFDNRTCRKLLASIAEDYR
jgi:hypothetical protein